MSDDELQELGEYARAARLAKKWSKERAAREADVSSITYKRLEDGLAVQDAKRAAIIAALDLSWPQHDLQVDFPGQPSWGRGGPPADETYVGDGDDDAGVATIKARKPANMSDEDFKRLLQEYEEEIEWKLDRAARER